MDTTPDSEFATQALEACIEHGRHILAAQLPLVEAGHFDLLRNFKEMTIQYFLVGVMWRFGEQFDLPVDARDRAFACLTQILVSDGMNFKAAKRRVVELRETARAPDGQDNLAMSIGYEAGDKDGALAAIFEQARNSAVVSGAPYRLIDRSKPVAAILAVAALTISVLMGRGWGEALSIGIIVGLSTLGIALAIYWQMMRDNRS